MKKYKIPITTSLVPNTENRLFYSECQQLLDKGFLFFNGRKKTIDGVREFIEKESIEGGIHLAWILVGYFSSCESQLTICYEGWSESRKYETISLENFLKLDF